jgi:hypothetical protein
MISRKLILIVSTMVLPSMAFAGGKEPLLPDDDQRDPE